jgi:enolase-phosphatase E1
MGSADCSILYCLKKQNIECYPQAKQDEADKVDGAVCIPEDNGDSSVEAVVKNVLWQMDLDRKTKALKQLQGHIMREGYKNGKLKGQ